MQRRGYKGTSTLMLPMMMMIITMLAVEMKRVLRVLVTMMNFRTCLHKELRLQCVFRHSIQSCCFIHRARYNDCSFVSCQICAKRNDLSNTLYFVK